MTCSLQRRLKNNFVPQVYTSNVSNGKEFLPLHIAAMSTKCPHNTIRILRNNFEQSFLARTSDGSLPIHLVKCLDITNLMTRPTGVANAIKVLQNCIYRLLKIVGIATCVVKLCIIMRFVFKSMSVLNLTTLVATNLNGTVISEFGDLISYFHYNSLCLPSVLEFLVLKMLQPSQTRPRPFESKSLLHLRSVIE